jgi:anti-anti-sigma factor
MASTHGSHWLQREDIGAVTVVRFQTPKKMDEDTFREVFEPIYTLVGLGRTQLVLNLGVVEFLPSMALGKLVMLNRKTQAGGGRLALCQLTPSARETLEVTRLHDLFGIYATEQDAVKSFA